MTGQFGLRPAGRPGSTRSSLPWRGSGQYARASAGGREVDPGNRRGIEGVRFEIDTLYEEGRGTLPDPSILLFREDGALRAFCGLMYGAANLTHPFPRNFGGNASPALCNGIQRAQSCAGWHSPQNWGESTELKMSRLVFWNIYTILA